MTRPGHIHPRADWLTVPAVVIASGPSLSDEQLHRVLVAGAGGNCRVITVNNTCQRAPWADVHYFGDYMAVKHYMPVLRGQCRGDWWSASRAAHERFATHYVKGVPRPGFGERVVHLNGNSGAQAINLAMCFGAMKVLLLGFDMQAGPKGEAHWFGQHPAHLVQIQLYREWMHHLGKAAPDAAARGVDIVNVTPGSALDCFRRGDLLEELKA